MIVALDKDSEIATVDIVTDFYDAMFGSINDAASMRKIEQKIVSEAEQLLCDHEGIAAHIPNLPSMLITLLDAVKNPHTDVFTLVNIIEKDPIFAAEVLKVANTAKYNRSGDEVIFLRKATSFLGLSGLLKIASTLLLSDVIPCHPLYYKLYGQQIWTHSVQCAVLCELIAKDEKKNDVDGYFIGLIHDLGKIVLFNAIAHTMSESFSSLTPCTRDFKAIITEMSAKVTEKIAQVWQLPLVYIEALEQQTKHYRAGLGDLLYRSNRLSENYLLFVKGRIVEEDYQLLAHSLDISAETVNRFSAIAPTLVD